MWSSWPGIRDEERAKNLIQQSAFLEFKLVVPVTELEAALSRIDRQIVGAIGADALREMGRDVEAPAQDLQNIIFGGQGADSAQADTAAAQGELAAEDEEPEVNLRPFTALLASGDVEGSYLVALEDVETARTFLTLPEVQIALPRDISLHWEADPTALGARMYQRLYVAEEERLLDR